MKISLGWAARRKAPPHDIAGWRQSVYSRRGMLVTLLRRRVHSGDHRVRRYETKEEVFAKWDIVEVFAEFPE